MTAQFARGPQPRLPSQPQNAPHAALLIDFDNVTMGIRSDLTKELKNLLNSDIIKGKVAVQRAYADWRRYPQYIVPLAENSVDLIFAPAYGSSKKNATDIRLAIDALELVFTRAEIGTFILLSGDSEFSSLVLKLKEYGKYVIGVGIRESSSDLLVQNCDEYYSYSGLTGLTRAGEDTATESFDPWELVDIAVRQMVEQRDVMRSDRLKQILLELDPNFSEKGLGFTKFNRFLQEAATRGLLHLKKMENGQFEVGPVEPAPDMAPIDAPDARKSRAARPQPEPRAEVKAEVKPEPKLETQLEAKVEAKPDVRPEAAPPPVFSERVPPAQVKTISSGDLREAYELMLRAAGDLARGKPAPIRDSDLKRRMLELQPGFDEGAYGFSKFSRFLRQAHDAEIINVNKLENGSYEITLGAKAASYRASPRPEPTAPAAASDAASVRADDRPARRRGRDRDRRPRETRAPDTDGRKPELAADGEPPQHVSAPKPERPVPPPPEIAVAAAAPPRTAADAAPVAASASSQHPKPGVALGFRRGSRRGPLSAAPPPILAGQAMPSFTAPAAQPSANATREVHAEAAAQQPPTRASGRRRAPEAIEPRSIDAPAADGKEVSVHPFDGLVLPEREAEVVDRLAGYKGVGRKSAEATVQAFGAHDVFRVLHEQPDRVRQTLGGRRAEQLLKGWQQDFAAMTRSSPARKSDARKKNLSKVEQTAPDGAPAPARKRKRGGRKSPGKKAGSASK